VPPDVTLIVYPGNVHRANSEEVRQLYEAVRLLRGRGRGIALVRTGTDYLRGSRHLAISGEAGIVELGQVDRPFLIELMKTADLFVQPGAPGPFNDYRLPSKLPEFMAIGRPLVLPAANVGLRLRHGVDALLLQRGSAEEIAGHIDSIRSDPALAARLAANARAFAERSFRWEVQAGKLEAFLRQVA
jgi:glycosyltransferase involved in cell wall biosynthesis